MKKKRHITKGLATFFHYTKRANERYGLSDVHDVEQKICIEIRNNTGNVKKVEKNTYLIKLQKKQYTVVYTNHRGIITFLPPGCHGTFAKPKGSLIRPDIDLSQYDLKPQKELVIHQTVCKPILTELERKETRSLRDVLFNAKREIDMKYIVQGTTLLEKILQVSIERKITELSNKLNNDILSRRISQSIKV